MDFPTYFRNMLLTLIPGSAPASGGTEVVIRCPHCGDSVHLRSKHLYISIGLNDTPPMFHCKLCQTSGIVSSDILMMWGIYDIDALAETISYNNKVFKMPKNMKFKDRDVYNINNSKVTDSNITKLKLKYLNDRLGSNLSYKDTLELKICMNLYDLIETNPIETLTRKPEVVDNLDKYFFGFISNDNAFLNMRNVFPDKVPDFMNKRYINYNLFGKNDNTQRMYVIPTSINLNKPGPIRIHVSEGPMDILSVYLNLRNTRDRDIYSSVCGSGYLNVIKNFIIRNKIINFELHFYKDNDTSDIMYYNIAETLRVYNCNIFLHTNIFPNEKDFGVRKENIKETIRQI